MSRFAWFLCVVCAATPAAAQETDRNAPSVSIPYVAQTSPAASTVTPTPKRPSVLVPMYGVFAALQGADYASTRRALGNGAGREANPVMEPLVGHPAAFVALKAASTAGTVWAGERIWRKNRIAAIVFMAAADGAVAVIVAHNYAIATTGR